MFYIIKRVVQQRLQTNAANYGVTHCLRHSSSSSNTAIFDNHNEPQKKNPDDEIKAALDIEASLFENSSLQHSPVSTRETLRQHSQRLLNKAKQAKHGKTQRGNTKAKPSVVEVAKDFLQQTEKPTKRKEKPEAPPVIKDSELGLEFERLSLNHPILGTLMTTARSRKRRDKMGQIVIEGRRLINEALDCGLRMQTLIFSQREQLALLSAEVAEAQRTQYTQIYKVPHHDLKIWSTLTTPPGLLAVFSRPTPKSIELKQALNALPITVVCDNIREPNNLGSIIRTCAALPCQQVVVTRGCCDPWDSKALRGGCGAQFRLPILDDVDWKDLAALAIPPGAADDCHVFVAENNQHKLSESEVETLDYTELQQTGIHNIVVIGGESHGVSDEAYKFVNIVGNRGKCVYIPLADGVDSLNVTSALTLILFELRKNLADKSLR